MQLTFTNLGVPEDENDRDDFDSIMEDAVKEVIENNLELDGGTLTVQIISIDNEPVTDFTVITFEVEQTIGVGGDADITEETLRQDVAEALDLDDIKELLETEELREEYGNFNLGKVESETGDGPLIIESVVRFLSVYSKHAVCLCD